VYVAIVLRLLKLCLGILEECHNKWYCWKLIPAENVLFWKQYRFTFCVWRWCLCLVL